MTEDPRILEQLSAYVDGELPEREAAEVARAIEADPALPRRLRQVRAVRELVRALPRSAAPEGFVDAVLAKAERPRLLGASAEPAGRRAVQWVRFLATAAVLLIAFSIGAVIVAMLWTASDYSYPVASTPGGPPKPTTLAGGAPEAPAPTQVAMAASDLPAVRRDLRKALLDCGLTEDPTPADHPDGPARNTFRVRRIDRDRVRFAVRADASRAREVLAALRRLDGPPEAGTDANVLHGLAGDSRIVSRRVVEPAASCPAPSVRLLVVTLTRAPIGDARGEQTPSSAPAGEPADPRAAP
jgi:hypothetical protein